MRRINNPKGQLKLIQHTFSGSHLREKWPAEYFTLEANAFPSDSPIHQAAGCHVVALDCLIEIQ